MLIGTADRVSSPPRARPASPIPGVHGFSEILYAFSSAGNNNGSAFAGLSANTPFYNTALGLAMLVRPLLAGRPGAGHRRLAGRARRSCRPAPGTLPTHTPLFVVLLVGVVILVGALTFVPALALGPIVEHLHDDRGEVRRMTPMASSVQDARRSSTPPIVRRAIVDSFRKLDPRRQVRNPVMFVV